MADNAAELKAFEAEIAAVKDALLKIIAEKKSLDLDDDMERFPALKEYRCTLKGLENFRIDGLLEEHIDKVANAWWYEKKRIVIGTDISANNRQLAAMASAAVQLLDLKPPTEPFKTDVIPDGQRVLYLFRATQGWLKLGTWKAFGAMARVADRYKGRHTQFAVPAAMTEYKPKTWELMKAV
jgi:hypothetical protein